MPDVAISCQTTGDPHVATLLGMTLSLSSCLAPRFRAIRRLFAKKEKKLSFYSEIRFFIYKFVPLFVIVP